MRHKFLALVVVCSAIGAGCTTNEEDSFPTPSQLSDALLTVTDMESGWEESQRQVFDTRSNENPSIDPSIWCAEAADASKNLETLAGDAGADVEMNWTKNESPRMMRLQAWSNADAKDYMKDAKASAEACDGVTNTDSNDVTTETEMITNRSIGDESVSWSEKTVPPAGTEGDKFESIGRTTVARFGDIVMVLQLGDAAPVGTSSLMLEEDWWDIVKLAADKLDNLSK